MSSEERDSEVSLSSLIDFDFCYHYKRKNHQSLLLEMKQDGFFQNRKPRKFEILKPKLNDEDIGILLNVFFYFHEKGIVWEQANFQPYNFR